MMAAVDDPKTLGRARLAFSDQHDIDEFVATLEKFERGDIGSDASGARFVLFVGPMAKGRTATYTCFGSRRRKG